MANEIEIVVRVKDQAAAGMQAVRTEVKAGGDAAAAEAERAGDKIGENLANGLTRDSQGRLRNAMGRFASDAEKEAAGLGGMKLPPLKTDDFEASFRKAMAEGEKAVNDAQAEIRRSFTSIESGSRTLRAAYKELDPSEPEKKAKESSGGFDVAKLKMAGLAAAALALAPALAAIPAAAATVTLGAGAMALGLGGVIKALHDYGAASEGGGQSGAQMAATAFSNAVAIKNAEQAIADAKKQAARSAEDSAEQIKNAQQGVVDAERQSASAAQSSADQIAAAQRGVADAAYSLAQAEQRLQDAEKSELDAQKALTQAREDAANQLQDLNNSAADSHLAVERATLNVAKAQENLAKVLGSSLFTDDQKKDAALALKEAQQALIDAKQRDVEATQKADAANKSGVDGMQQVVSAQDAVAKAAGGVKDAQHGVAQAQQAQADAQQALARATQAAAQQQVSSAQSVAKAEQALADAQRSADRQRQDSMESVAKAEQNLADTYKQQQLSAAAAASAGSGAADKFAADMAALTPAGQAFVKQLLSMKDGAKQLSDTAQTAMLPGLSQMLKDSGPMLPIFNGAIDKMGHIIGDTATQFGKLMQSPAFQGQLTKVLDDGAGLAQKFGDGLVGMTNGVFQAASKAGPIVDGLGNGIKTLMTSGIPDFFNGLAGNASGIGQTFQGILTFVSNLSGPLGTISGAMAASLAPAIKILASPDVQRSLDSIASSIGRILIALSPVITLFAQGLAGALKVISPLLAGTAQFLEQNHRWLFPLAGIILAVWSAVKLWTIAMIALNVVLDANPIVLIGAAILGLVIAVKAAWDHFSGFRDFVKRMWADISGVFMGGVRYVEDTFKLLVSAGESAWGRLKSDAKAAWGLVQDYIVNPLKTAYDTVTGKFSDLYNMVTGLPKRLLDGTGNLWDWLAAGMKEAVNGVVGGMNWVVDRINGMTGGMSDLWSWAGIPRIGQIDHLPTMKAAGGPLGMGGLTAIVGERGAEILNLPNGTQVMPHANTQAAMATRAPGATPVQLEWVGPVGDELFTLIKRWIRVNYGSGPDSVQRALGQA